MANKALKSIKFPGLSDTYKIAQQAANFSTSTNYAAGDYCQYQGLIYRFTSAHSGAWNASHVTETTILADLMAGTEETAGVHLGFYLDENGDLCQVD